MVGDCELSRGKKQFIKINLKSGSAREEIEHPSDALAPVETVSIGTRVLFQKTLSKSFDFKPWYGGGVDQITSACQNQIERFLQGLDAEVAQMTVVTYCQIGMRWFLEYTLLRAAALRRELTLADINRELLDGYLGSLDGGNIGTVTKKMRYGSTKAVLKALCDRGLIEEVRGGDKATFPLNPFPGAHRSGKGYKPLTTVERKAFSVAVKKAVAPILLPDVEPTSYLLAYALLVIALHTGRNTTPLLEMSRDCLRPHPKTDIQFLVVFKRRGHAESKVALQAGLASHGSLESLATLRPSVVDLIKRVITLSDQLRPEAPDEIRNSVWLYRMQTPGRGTGTIGAVSALTEGTLAKAIKELVRNYDLVNADGGPMEINVSRLRKSFINRVYEILDGDVAATAAAAGNTANVVGINYLRPSENAATNWRFMGLTLTSELLTGTLGKTERTPVARCSDAKSGEYAPKRNDLICTSFLNCLRCRNLVVTADDLYKLFSFYWRVLKERSRMDPRRWKRQMAHIVRLIDRDVIEAGVANGVFKQSTVDQERSRALNDPHPFWRTDVALVDLSTLGAT